ncbi:hypothetical protein MPLB_1040004 [Mesorhizobium sp. ORS 3324]|nr:hypothetical protein MPLB_1040004 [Mesorhizobium sp. ORS 3324]
MAIRLSGYFRFREKVRERHQSELVHSLLVQERNKGRMNRLKTRGFQLAGRVFV